MGLYMCREKLEAGLDTAGAYPSEVVSGVEGNPLPSVLQVDPACSVPPFIEELFCSRYWKNGCFYPIFRHWTCQLSISWACCESSTGQPLFFTYFALLLHLSALKFGLCISESYLQVLVFKESITNACTCNFFFESLFFFQPGSHLVAQGFSSIDFLS